MPVAAPQPETLLPSMPPSEQVAEPLPVVAAQPASLPPPPPLPVTPDSIPQALP
jgi:hypothetical protein